MVGGRPKLSNCTFTASSGHSDQNGLERQALTGEMLRLDPLLTLREAVGPVPGLNKHLTDSSPPKDYPRDQFPDTVNTVKSVEQMHASPNGDSPLGHSHSLSINI